VPATHKTIVKIKNLSKSFGDLKLFDKINLDIKEGEIVTLIGFSGCGKSTLLKMIAGLEDPSSGTIELNKVCKLGMAFQFSALFDSLTIAENIAFPLIVGENLEKVYSEEELKALVKERLSLVGLPGIEDQYPSELSGGMKKRISFARAVVDNPGLVLYDEPTAGLDPVASTIVEDLILKLQKEVKASAILVTHQFSTIRRASDRVIMIHDKHIVWEGTPDELFSSDDPYAKQFREGNPSGPMQVQH
jgi:phospholipid/cholesterol/gamma-HCH transport system ATP-binding protein